LFDLAGLETAEGKFREAQRMYRECLRIYGPESLGELPRILEALAMVKVRVADSARALTVAGAAAAIRERFFVTADRTSRPELEQHVEAARQKLGAEATEHWMKGWNMSATEIVDWATQEGEEPWTTSHRQ
jgi:hypothetical protein